MEIRHPLEWHCKQMDHFVGLNFSANFNFALVGHLLKGRQNLHLSTPPTPPTSSCTYVPFLSLQATDTRLPPRWRGR